MSDNDSLFHSLVKQEKEDKDHNDKATETGVGLSLSPSNKDTEEKSVGQETEGLLKNANGAKIVGTDYSHTGKDLQEESGSGGIPLLTYLKYIGAGSNYFIVFIFCVFTIGVQVCNAFSGLWLSKWANETKDNKIYDKEVNSYYYGVYVGVVVLLIITTLLFVLMLFSLTIRASRKLHNIIFIRILTAKCGFFNVNPIGRILNRFSKDMGNMDDLLPHAFLDVLWIFFIILSMLSMIVFINPYMLIPSFSLMAIFYFLRMFYLQSSRAIKRVEAVARSPIFSLLGASLEGLPVVRAFKMQDKLIKLFNKTQDIHSSAWFSFIASSRWLGVVSDWTVCLFLIFSTYGFMFLKRDKITEADVGVSISFSFFLTGALQYGLRQSAEVENLMTSVERIMEYEQLESEGDLVTSKNLEKAQRERPNDDKSDTVPKAPEIESWITKGVVEFKNVHLSYSKTSPPVLKGITVKTEAAEKIGIVGRTGAGKSSMISVLFRLFEPEGDIIIDGRPIKEMGLHDLRKNISIIPQDPLLFTGSLRANLDPFDNYTDSDIWKALEQAYLLEAANIVDGGLEMMVTEGGSNFSVGQRQLICLARAILKHNKVMVLDEATANVDPKTDFLIQSTLRERFENCTVFTIAHRLNTIMDSDRIIVLGEGEILEIGVPHLLLQNEDGALSQLLLHTGYRTQEKLKSIAKEAHAKSRCSSAPLE